MPNSNNTNLLLVRIGEIILKGLNRGNFVRQMIRNIRFRINDLGDFDIHEHNSRVWVRALSDDIDMKEVIERVTDVFGIVSVSPVQELPLDYEELKHATLNYVGDLLAKNTKSYTFKLETRRVNKSFPMGSYEISADLGAILLEAYPERLKVDVHQPDFIVQVEIRDSIYLFHRTIPGPSGLPSGMSGKGMLLISGGIDSPVAGYMMASRGMRLEAIYFHTFPYTGPEALKKVEDLTRIVSRYAGSILFHQVDFTEAMLALVDACPEDMLTVVMRRLMFLVAEKLARSQNAKCLITGESLGQVASQTMEAIVATDAVTTMPVFRPLIGIDKNDTVEIARRIGTYDTSILPYDDCCTVFVSKHPKTHPSLLDVEIAEEELDLEALADAVLDKIDTYPIKAYT
ncbi:MAG: tRNA 4-thiouridine(8) synthase ThiI [Eubacteriales bacterium]|nr:tRNA 4-thiouridine(8) synthase ThiI [Eubacteriales bacterium]MDD4540920.1 tRNA 4-thiouridine(8) synthase ThiI [Eubacteriales bacterium]